MISDQGEFYNIGKHKEPPFSPPLFALPPQVNNMLYIGVSSFTANSAAFVYNNAGAFNIFVTDDMVSRFTIQGLMDSKFEIGILTLTELNLTHSECMVSFLMHQ